MSFPAWFYGPNGESQMFQRREDVPEGWADSPARFKPEADCEATPDAIFVNGERLVEQGQDHHRVGLTLEDFAPGELDRLYAQFLGRMKAAEPQSEPVAINEPVEEGGASPDVAEKREPTRRERRDAQRQAAS